MNILTSVLVITAIIALLLFALREIMCWYWKVNERIELQKRTNELLEKLINR